MIEKTFTEWLDWIKSLHIKQIDLGLSRVQKVLENMNLKMTFPIITVAGTNGKGSTVAGLESVYLAAGFKTGAFTSPFLFRYNEQIKILGKEISDEALCSAFAKVEAARKDITLTPFEFNTLAALEVFQNANLDVVILEVGLGGRLDAVNVVDADVAIVTSIGIDHADYLGDTREKIAKEKAGIFRKNKPAICGDYHPPQSLVDYAKEINAKLYCQNQDFGFDIDGFHWNWWSENTRYENLTHPKLALQNMSTALMAVELLQNKLPVKQDAIEKALKTVSLTGRIQIFTGDVLKIFDVSHNPTAVLFLANYLKNHPVNGKTRAVFSMLADKDIVGTLWVIKNAIDEWYTAPLGGDRAASKQVLEYCFRKVNFANVNFYDSLEEAYKEAEKNSQKGDRIVVFGSFHTVAEILKETK